ncbi:hypothetical protein FACS1894161_2800 [Spirochaetia bacterium]|nr:hypothetical protein FACS1894161_2800 [Spirochaetia bacterium]
MAQNGKLDFKKLVVSIKSINEKMLAQVSRAVNMGLTLRNWLIGYYIAEYELRGEDRANYGDGVVTVLAEHLKDVSNCNKRQLYRYLKFFRLYPQIVGSVNPLFMKYLPESISDQKVGTVSPLSESKDYSVMERLAYSHIELLVEIDDDTKRLFYEVECIKGNWSVRELKRQIGSLYYERSGLSKNRKKLSEITNLKTELQDTRSIIRDPYIFEWLGIEAVEKGRYAGVYRTADERRLW